MADRCSCCGSTTGSFNEVGGLFTVLMCADCQADRGHGSGPYAVMTRAEMRAGATLPGRLPSSAWHTMKPTSRHSDGALGLPPSPVGAQIERGA
jgi:hypothetical protein